MEHLEGILKLVDREFGEMEKNGKFRTKEDIDLAYKMIDIAKDIYEVWDCEDKMNADGYSEYGYNMYPMNGMSYARGRNAARNSMGQYSRGGMSYRDGGGYSDNYSTGDAKRDFINSLYSARDKAMDDQERQNIQRMIDNAERR